VNPVGGALRQMTHSRAEKDAPGADSQNAAASNDAARAGLRSNDAARAGHPDGPLGEGVLGGPTG
jgi:hypothetical protein